MFKLKNIRIVFVSIFVAACNSETASDCFQRAGDIVADELVVADFNQITVFENVAMILKQGPETKVVVETGKNLRNQVDVSVENGRLLLRDTNTCNFVRDYGLTKVYVTAPNITEIKSSTGLPIKSEGVLNYRSLALISESFNNPEAKTKDGSFDLNLNVQSLTIVVNGLAYFKLNGTADFFRITVAAGDSRIEAGLLEAQVVNFDHRGSNDLFVNPRDEIIGRIRGTGNVHVRNQPPMVDVQELYKGKLIFNK